MSDEEKWEWQSVGGAYNQVRLTSWQHFTDFVHSVMLDYDTYIWRGQRCDDWVLESTIDRLISDSSNPITKEFSFRSNHLEQFKFAVRGRRGANPPEIKDENEWWALGQHHGLSTPLLDWTTSPFVAAYFAFIKQDKNQTSHRAIYALHKPSVEIKSREIQAAKEEANRKEKEAIRKGEKSGGFLTEAFLDYPVRPDVEFIRPLSDENHRLVNQGGLFTRAPDGKPLDDWVGETFTGASDNILIKILIPDSDREECLKILNRMNINHLTLFPDLYGASKFCNLFGEIKNY
ncbi:MAG: FRG domain-containing protein [Candidatus Thiodiazotropha taylori]|nr:FRG domain-containing protein [Candidatus Thiodiazotropha endolucinida]MCW4229653.1 FRG domain-containing protein [Candidatus Thiodiazotropha taylori]